MWIQCRISLVLVLFYIHHQRVWPSNQDETSPLRHTRHILLRLVNNVLDNIFYQTIYIYIRYIQRCSEDLISWYAFFSSTKSLLLFSSCAKDVPLDNFSNDMSLVFVWLLVLSDVFVVSIKKKMFKRGEEGEEIGFMRIAFF
jgi:hypothetical protein